MIEKIKTDVDILLLVSKLKKSYLRPFSFSLPFFKFWKENYVYFGHEHVETRRVHSVGSNVANSIRFIWSEAPFFGCRIFDIRSAVRRMSNIRNPKRLNSDIEHSMSAGCSLQLLTRHQTIYIHCIIVF